MTLKDQLEVYTATEADLASARVCLREIWLQKSGTPGRLHLGVILEKEIATCEAHRDCVQMMLELISPDRLEKAPEVSQMVALTKIMIATQLLRESIRKKQ